MNIPAFSGLENQLLLWMLVALRPGAAFITAPVFGQASVPLQLRLLVALAVGLPALTNAQMAIPPEGIVSIQGLLIIMGEIVLGLALGFAVQIGFAASQLAGEAISNAMGLGFASMVNPIDGQMSPAIGQILTILATFLFLLSNGHLMLVAIVADSYNAMPVGRSWLSFEAIQGLVHFGGLIFAAGLSIALPVGFAMVMVQIVMGVVGRSTPTLNLFAVGMPVALLAGVVLLAISLPSMTEGIAAALTAGIEHATVMAKGQ